MSPTRRPARRSRRARPEAGCRRTRPRERASRRAQRCGAGSTQASPAAEERRQRVAILGAVVGMVKPLALYLALLFLVTGCGGAPVPAASAPASAAPTPSAAPVKITITYGSVAADVLPTYVALEQGIFLRNGLDAELQLISSSTAAVAALVSGNADFSQAGGSVANPPETTSLEQAGFHSVLDLAGLKLPASVQTTIVKRETVRSKPDVVQRYVDSLVQAIAYMKKNKPAVVNVLKKYFKSTDDAAMGAAYDFYTNEVIPAQPFPRPELFGDAISALAARND